jgi:hypothetical protein
VPSRIIYFKQVDCGLCELYLNKDMMKYIYIYICVYIYVCVYIYIYSHVYIYIDMYICVFFHIYVKCQSSH